jgi:hypothetical protein
MSTKKLRPERSRNGFRRMAPPTSVPFLSSLTKANILIEQTSGEGCSTYVP